MAEDFSLSERRIFVAGHRGMVGSALVRRLASEGCEVMVAGRGELDLKEQSAVRDWFLRKRPDAVFLAAAKVGGILANAQFPADFLYDNIVIETNIIEAAHRYGVKKLLFLGSSCIYPRFARQPIEEDALLTGCLEPTNEWYAVAKIAGLKLCQAYRRQYGDDFISAMPTNLFGPGDNFDLSSSHVLPALMRKAHYAKLNCEPQIEVWGTGSPRREFMHVDDLADACVYLMRKFSQEQHINVGSGMDIMISDLVGVVCDVVGYEGIIRYDRSKPDGTPRKLMSDGKLRAMGWQPRIELRDGIASTYQWFLKNHVS